MVYNEDETELKADTVARCREAYAANGIPWNGDIASRVQKMSVAEGHALAAYWEKRAVDGPKEVWPDEPPVVESDLCVGPVATAKKTLKRVIARSGNGGSLNRPMREGQKRFTVSQINYNGRGGPIND